MKKLILLIALSLLVVVAGACSKDKVPEKQDVGDETKAQNMISAEALAAFGQTYAQLKSEYPNYVASDENNNFNVYFYDAAFPYFGAQNSKYNFVFYGSQDGPWLAEVVKYYGNEIKCIGVTGTVGDIFPEMTGDMSFEDFFSFLEVKDYKYGEWDTDGTPLPNSGELTFKYENFDVVIDARGAKDTKIVQRGYTVLITSGDKMVNDSYLEKTSAKLGNE